MTFLPGKYACLSMLPTYHQWSHCWICTLQQVEHQYRLPGIPCKYHPKCSHGVFLLQFVTATMCFFGENGRNPSSCHLFLSRKPGTHRVILMTFAAVGLPCKAGGTPIQEMLPLSFYSGKEAKR